MANKVDYEQVLRDVITIDSEGFPVWRATGKYCKISTCGRGYPSIQWKANGAKGHKSVYVGRLVATALVPNPRNLPYVQFINGDISNFHPSNLEWSSHKKHLLNRYNGDRLDSLIQDIVDCKTIDGARAIISGILTMENTRRRNGRS